VATTANQVTGPEFLSLTFTATPDRTSSAASSRESTAVVGRTWLGSEDRSYAQNGARPYYTG
jgi:hypothetical protein